MMMVHSDVPGMVNKPYDPAGIVLLPIVTGSEKVNLVAAFAPVLHTSPIGANKLPAPNTGRPFKLGLE